MELLNTLLSWFRNELDTKPRNIYPNHILIDRRDDNARNYPTNRIKTSRYTLINFIPKNLWEQYQSAAIVLFTLMAMVYNFAKAAVSIWSTLGPLIGIIVIAMIKDFVEDVLRQLRDRQVNKRLFKIAKLTSSGNTIEWVDIRAEDIRVGDVLLIKRDQEFPCDLIALASASPSTEVKLTTANLDGETSIKNYHALVSTQPLYSQLYPTGGQRQLDLKLWFELECEPPNIDLSKFEGRFRTITTSDNNNDQLTDWLPLSTDNLLLRGARIKQTDFVIACCVYTGQETKLSINGLPIKRKFTSRDRRFNQILLAFVAGMLACSLASTISYHVWTAENGDDAFYLPKVDFSVAYFVQNYLNFIFIYVFLVPISMVLTLDFQLMLNSFLLSRDLELYSEELDKRSNANSILLADELGQVEYLFSDKTGTLTKNQMKLRFCATLTNEQQPREDDNQRLVTIYACYDDRSRRVPQYPIRSLSQALAEMSQCKDWIAEDLCYSSSSDSDSSSTGGGDESSTKSSSSVRKRRHNARFSREASIRQSRSLQSRCIPINLSNNSNLVEVFKLIALCHTVEVADKRDEKSTQEKITESPTARCYEATSPDEKALVEGAANLGVVLSNAEPNRLVPGGLTYTLDLSNLKKTKESPKPSTSSSTALESSSSSSTYHIDAVLPFDPFRKRMTIMVRHPDGSFHIHGKGADSVMLASTSSPADSDKNELKRIATSCVNEFAQLGLRTLVYSTRRLKTQSEYDQLIDQLRRALGVVGSNRQQAISDAHLAIESRLMPVAVTAVEDSLQDGVKDCLKCLTEAGIKTWVLTGDKEETAITVSKSAGHFPQDGHLCRLTHATSIDSTQRLLDAVERNFEGHVDIEEGQPASSTTTTVKSSSTLPSAINRWSGRTKSFIRSLLRKSSNAANKDDQGINPTGSQSSYSAPLCLVIDGATIDFLLSANIVAMVQSGSLMTKSRRKCHYLDEDGPISNKDAGQVQSRWTMIQRLAGRVWRSFASKYTTEGPITAAIGDGGNDVAMLIRAHVGIGLYGNESLQAARSADYSLTSFACLKRLLLVHGHWANHRLTMTMNIFYFKCVALVSNQIIFSFFNAFSQMTNFESMLYTMYNMTLTSLPVFLFGFFEQHLSADQLMRHPHLYRLLRKQSNLSCGYVVGWIVEGLWHAGVIFALTNLLLADQTPFYEIDRKDPRAFVSEVDLGMTGYAMFALLCISVNIRVALWMRNLNSAMHVGFLLVLCNVPLLYAHEKGLPVGDLHFAAFTNVFFCPSFWLILPLTLFTCLLPGLVWRLASDLWWKGQMKLAKMSHGHDRRRLRSSWRFWVGVMASSNDPDTDSSALNDDNDQIFV